MLRITHSPDAVGVCLKVEGRLAGDWVSLLERELAEAASKQAALSLDLAAVDFATPTAIEMLQAATARGVRVVACSLFLSNQLSVSAR